MKKLVIKKQSKQWYKEATKYLTTYYGQLAHLKINLMKNLNLKNNKKLMMNIKNIFIKKI